MVSIIVAIYNPNVNWLKEQLLSLNAQTYRNIEIILCDDCSTRVEFSEIEEVVADSLTSVCYKLLRNEHNMGVNATFEKMIREDAKGKFIAFCDQDDIWYPEKIEKCRALFDEDTTLVYCGHQYVDEEKNCISADIDRHRKSKVILEGTNLAPKYISKCFVAGCFMMVRAEIVIKCLPFHNSTVYDHWTLLYAAAHGTIKRVPEKLISHRRHSSTQTGMLANIGTKADYLRHRLLPYEAFMKYAYRRLSEKEELEPFLRKASVWSKNRVEYWQKVSLKNLLGVLKGVKFDGRAVLFEAISRLMPDGMFVRVVGLIRK